MQSDFTIIEGFGEVTILHNSDYSGLATIRWIDPADGKMRVVELPGALFLAVSKEVAISLVRDRVGAALERI